MARLRLRRTAFRIVPSSMFLGTFLVLSIWTLAAGESQNESPRNTNADFQQCSGLAPVRQPNDANAFHHCAYSFDVSGELTAE